MANGAVVAHLKAAVVVEVVAAVDVVEEEDVALRTR